MKCVLYWGIHNIKHSAYLYAIFSLLCIPVYIIIGVLLQQ